MADAYRYGLPTALGRGPVTQADIDASVALFSGRRLVEILGVDLQPVFETGDIEVCVGPSADRQLLLLRRSG